MKLLRNLLHFRANHDTHIDFEGLSYEEGIVSDHQELDVYEIINRGTFGRVYRGVYRIHSCAHPGKEIDVAVKKISSKSVYQEVETLLELKQESEIIHLYNYHVDKNNHVLVTELCKGGDMVDFVTAKGPLFEKDAISVLKWLLTAVQKCHRHGICHSDIKLDNIGIMRKDCLDELKLLDFGNSIRVQDCPYSSDKVLGSARYAAPELFGEAFLMFSKDLFLVDAWSIGVIAFILVTKRFPFMNQKYRLIAKEDLAGVSPEYCSFVTELLSIDPKKRMSILDALNHSAVTRNV